MDKTVSFLMLTIDRYDITREVWANNNLNHGYAGPTEWLVADNGSQDRRIVEFFKGRTQYHRVNSQNEGCARAFNQLFLRAKGEYICLMGNDIRMPHGWLAEMVKYADAVPNSGLVGVKVEGLDSLPPLSTKFGFHAHYLNEKYDKVFGVTLFKRRVVEEVGLFCEEFHPYGLEDSDFNNRVNRAGFNSLYVPNMVSIHVGWDTGENSAYRQMKNQSLSRGLSVLRRRMEQYDTQGLREPLPPMREPI